MDRNKLREWMCHRLGERAGRLGLRVDELEGSLDLVRSGLLDSLGFVDLITEMERVVGHEVDLAAAFDKPGATTINGVLSLFQDA